MYKVIIVDDEPIICEGLKKGVRWNDFNCEVAGCAENGLEGLELVRQLTPDILFSDIAMNNMDGLAMVAALRSEFPSLEITLLTGYRNFEYAQRAIKLGVTRFLLKPSRMDEIEEAITAMTDRLRSHGNMGEEVIDNLWNMQKERERYLYDTFLRGQPGPGQEGRIRDTEANGVVLKSALEYIEQRHTEKLSLSDVADHCYVSSWHLSKLLNQYTGKGFFEIINIIRVDRAKAMLQDAGLRIQDISEQIGFQDVAHFSRIFKSLTGQSPREYRANH